MIVLQTAIFNNTHKPRMATQNTIFTGLNKAARSWRGATEEVGEGGWLATSQIKSGEIKDPNRLGLGLPQVWEVDALETIIHVPGSSSEGGKTDPSFEVLIMLDLAASQLKSILTIKKKKKKV